MTGNGGEITVGQRLARIEAKFDKFNDRLETVEGHLDERITRHKRDNERAVEKLATSVVTNFGKRVEALEKKDIAEDAKAAAVDAAKKEAQSNKRWVIGVGFTLGTLLLGAIGLLIQLLGKVG